MAGLSLDQIEPTKVLGRFGTGSEEDSQKELKEVLLKVGGKSEDADEIVSKLQAERGIISVDDFVKFFRNPAKLAEFYDGQPAWKKRAPIFVTMQNVIDSVSKAEDKIKKQEESAGDDGTPMDPELNNTLNQAWKKKYGFPLHPSMEYGSQLLNGMYRALKQRSGKAEIVKGLYTLENSLHKEGKKDRREPISKNIELVDKTRPWTTTTPGALRRCPGGPQGWAPSTYDA